jgi:hypothetical protein
MTTVAAVVPQWNRSGLLQSLLDSCAAQTRKFDEIIVVDNGSTDDSAAVAERAGAQVLRLGSNLGFAAAVNRGIKAARADWIAILNNDVTLSSDWLQEIVTVAASNDVWFAASKVLSASAPGMIDGAFDEISRGACACRCGAGKPDGPLWNRRRSIAIAPMTAALFRRTLFDDVGFLDEAFESYMEDVDFGLRCALAGRAGIYVPQAVAKHVGSATLGQWNKDTVRLIARNQVLLAAKHFRGQPRWPIMAGQLLWGLLAFRHGRGWSYLRGKASGLGIARRWRGEPEPTQREALRSVVTRSEDNIVEVGQQTGFDRYWRVYFWLLRR